MKSKHLIKKFDKYVKKIAKEEENLPLLKEGESKILYCVDEFKIDRKKGILTLSSAGMIGMDLKMGIELEKNEEINDIEFIITEVDENGELYATIVRDCKNPYAENSPLKDEDGYIKVIPACVFKHYEISKRITV